MRVFQTVPPGPFPGAAAVTCIIALVGLILQAKYVSDVVCARALHETRHA